MWRLVGALWVLPVAVPIWIFYLHPAWALGWLTPIRRHGLVVEFFAWPHKGPGWWRRAWRNWAGHALPFAIVVSGWIVRERVRRHELRHCSQWFALGPLFPLVYGLLLGIYGYANHPLELDAQRHEEEV